MICPFPVMVHPHVPMQLAPLSKAKRLVEQGWLANQVADLVRQQDEVREVSIAAYGNACASRMLARGDELLSAAARGERRVSDSAPSKEEIQRAANDVAAWVDMDEARKYTADIEALAKLQSSEEEGP